MLSTTIVHTCRRCGSERIRKNGHAINGAQRAKCLDCERTFILQPVGPRYDQPCKDQVLNAYQDRMTDKQAETFAEGLTEQINADPYAKMFNEMVGHGETTEELNAMHASSGALLQAEPTLTEGAEFSLATPVGTSPISTEASEPVTAKPAEVPESAEVAPESVTSGSGEVSSATGAALGMLNIFGVLHDFLVLLR